MIGKALSEYAEIIGNVDAIGITFSIGVGLGFNVEADLTSVAYFINGADKNKTVVYGSGSLGTIIGANLSGSVNIVLFYYQGNVENFNRNSIAGYCNDKAFSLPIGSYIQSEGDLTKTGEKVISHYIGVGPSVGTKYGWGSKRQNTKLFRPFRRDES